ncbi:transketolase family protein [Roseospira marina]|uniref:Transketolase family protein n=2 Tax=Roseospira marina TaxID=140057 RepID=A0A5M6IAQ2_9PROT|nr:transketolase family protein [Roseospira marina]
MIDAFFQAVDDGVNLAVVVSDSTSTAKLAPFQAAHPERVVNVGIAEQSLVGVAAGLSLGGYVPVTANAAPFLVARANEQVKNDVCYSNTNVKLVGLNAGVAYGPLGSTHHAIDDLSIMQGFGTIQILAPSDAVEARRMFAHAFAHEGPVYIRLDNAKLPVLHEDGYRFTLGEPDRLREGAAVTLVAVGSVVHEAVAAADALAAKGVDAGVVSVPSIRPLNRPALAHMLRAAPLVVTVEEHSVHGGLGSLVAEIMAENALGSRLIRIGIPDGQFAKTGPRAAIRAYYGLDSAGILREVQNARATVA